MTPNQFVDVIYEYLIVRTSSSISSANKTLPLVEIQHTFSEENTWNYCDGIIFGAVVKDGS